MKAWTIVIIVLIAFEVVAATRLTNLKTKLRKASKVEEKSAEEFVIKPADDGVVDNQGDRDKLTKLQESAALATEMINQMVAWAADKGKDDKFTTAFGDATLQAVKDNLDKMQKGKTLALFQLYSDKSGAQDKEGTFAGAAVAGPGSTRLFTGPVFHTQTVRFQAEALVHEASHAFASTIDLHDGKNGYIDSEFFNQVKGANNADSYRRYAQLVYVAK